MQVHGFANRVLFRQACSNIPKDAIVLEIGPHALLRSAIRQNRPDLQYAYTMKKGESSVETLQNALADLWLKGASVYWLLPEVSAAAQCEEILPSSHFSYPRKCTNVLILHFTMSCTRAPSSHMLRYVLQIHQQKMLVHMKKFFQFARDLSLLN